jgi:chromosome segregation ATPase
VAYVVFVGSTSDHLSDKQSQAILKQLTKEKEHLEEQCSQHQIQISILQSENEVLKTRCANYEEEICNMTASIFCANEKNEYLQQNIQDANQENQRFKEENERLKQGSQHLRKEDELFKAEIEPQDHYATEIQETTGM